MNIEMKMMVENAIPKILKLNSLKHEIKNLEKIMGFASKEIINNKSTSVGQKVDTILNLYLKRPEKVREELDYINKMSGDFKTGIVITEIMKKVPNSILMNPDKTPGEIAEYIWSSLIVKPFDNSDLVFNNVKDSSNAYKLDKEREKSFNERKYISERPPLTEREKDIEKEIRRLCCECDNRFIDEDVLEDEIRKISPAILNDATKLSYRIAKTCFGNILKRELENTHGKTQQVIGELENTHGKTQQVIGELDPTSSAQDASDLNNEIEYKESLNIEEFNKLSDKEKMGLIYLAYEQLETSYKDQSKLEIDCIKEFLK